MKRQNIHWGRRGLGLYSLTFISAPPSQGEEGFLSLFSLFFFLINLFIFVCVGSLLLCAGFL